MRRIEAYELSPEQEAEIIAEIAFENEYNRLLIEGVDVPDDEGCELCAGLTLNFGEFDLYKKTTRYFDPRELILSTVPSEGGRQCYTKTRARK